MIKQRLACILLLAHNGSINTDAFGMSTVRCRSSRRIFAVEVEVGEGTINPDDYETLPPDDADVALERIIINFLDILLNAIVGTNFASVVGDAQSAISSLVANASHFVLSTVSNIGNMSVVEIIQHLLTLVIAITDILLKVMNAIIYLISGNDGVTWALLATSSVKEASSQLLAHTSSTYHDFTHASLTELANSFGDYGQVVGNELLALIGSLESVVDKNSFDGISIPDDLFESAVTVLQTGLSF